VLISRAHGLVFLKTKKTAGTSVEVYLERASKGFAAPPLKVSQREEYDDGQLIIGRRSVDVAGAWWWNHMPAALVRERLGAEWERMLKTCCVRNPFDKAISAFWMQTEEPRRKALLTGPFETARDAFRAWLLGGGDLMADRDVHSIDGRPCVDHLIRYESLHADLETLCGKVGLPWVPAELGTYKSRRRYAGVGVDAYYDRASLRRVSEAFGYELEVFGYRAPEAVD
jgi:hypothetical protein